MNNNDIKYCIVVQSLYIYVMFLIVFSHSERMGKTPCLYQTRALSTLSLTQKIPCPYMTLARLTVAINVQVCIICFFKIHHIFGLIKTN